MKKEAYYFSHDANARNDVKILKVRRQLGPEGYAIFFMLIEVLREQLDYKLPLSSIPDLAYDFDVSEEKVKTVVNSYDLFQITEETFFSERLTRSMYAYNQKRMRYIEAGSRGGQASVKHRLSKGQAIKGNKRKGNEIKKREPNGVSVGDFYQKEIASNAGHELIEKYRAVVEMFNGKNQDELIYKNLLSMRQQLSFPEYLKLRTKGKETGEDVFDVLKGMENKKGLAQKNESIYLTAINWINIRTREKK